MIFPGYAVRHTLIPQKFRVMHFVQYFNGRVVLTDTAEGTCLGMQTSLCTSVSGNLLHCQMLQTATLVIRHYSE